MYHLVAYDVLVYGVNESLTFDATNAAKGLVMFLLSDSNLSTDRLITDLLKDRGASRLSEPGGVHPYA